MFLGYVIDVLSLLVRQALSDLPWEGRVPRSHRLQTVSHRYVLLGHIIRAYY